MQNAKELIDHIYKNPLYKKLKPANECREFVALLSRAHQNLIAFCFLRGEELVFALKHPLGLSELKRDSSIFMIKGLLKTFLKAKSALGEESALKDVSEIKFFVTDLLKFKPVILETRITPLRSKAKFANLAKDSDIFAKFEELRAVIIARNEKYPC